MALRCGIELRVEQNGRDPRETRQPLPKLARGQDITNVNPIELLGLIFILPRVDCPYIFDIDAQILRVRPPIPRILASIAESTHQKPRIVSIKCVSVYKFCSLKIGLWTARARGTSVYCRR